mmetsp:Transcript_10369/g.31220  ORF Transcript_10369/g.31220 Transcript_10369/m.31220 type:complete len:730 (+) Transcript_10369:1-2190(+)
MGGLNRNEFTAGGYAVPKPMVPIVGRPMLFWILDNLELQASDSVWLGCKRDVEAEYGIERAVRHEYPTLDVHFVCFDFDTRGATETLYCVLNAMDAKQRSRRTISLDCDTLWFCDVLGGARALPPDSGASFYFMDDMEDDSAPYSYIRVDPRTQAIVDIREKVAISRLANNGAYVFASAAQALAGLEDLLDEAFERTAPPPAPSTPTNDAEKAWIEAEEEAASQACSAEAPDAVAYSKRHHYVSGLIARLIGQGHSFLAVEATAFATLGTPNKLRAFLGRLRRGEVLGARAMRFCFALDGTLVTAADAPGAYGDAKPIARNVAIARQLHAAGHTIIVWTDRGMDGARGNAGAAMAKAGATTFQQLADFGIPYDELLFGKPQADVYVDARAVSSLGAHVERALGWDLADDGAANTDLAGGVKPRHFNSVRRVGDDHVEKTGPRSVLRGEVFWYQHVPEELSDLFPRAVSVSSHPDRDLSSMIMTRVNGVTFSHLAADACLTPGRLGALLDALRRLHVAPARPGSAKPSDALVCSNYAKKVAARFAKHEKFFRSFDDDDETGVDTRVMARKVLAFLEDYEKGARFQTAAHVHGDPVFSNVLLTHDGSVKFLDMRGALGDELTTAGDVAYDLSKVYQSLCGYDAIILDVELTAANEATLARLRGVFEAWLARRYSKIALRDIKLIVASHYFCIVPLHDNKAHQKQFLAKAKWLLDEDEASSDSSDSNQPLHP